MLAGRLVDPAAGGLQQGVWRQIPLKLLGQGTDEQGIQIGGAGLLPVIQDSQGEGRITCLGPDGPHGIEQCGDLRRVRPGGHDHLAVGEIRHPAEREARIGEGPEVRHLDEVAIAGEVDG
ncbi:hypothetical protein D3C86_1892210 [compost metagenome]